MKETTDELITEHNILALFKKFSTERFVAISNELSTRFDAMGDEEQALYYEDLNASPFTTSVWHRHFRPFKKPEEQLHV